MNTSMELVGGKVFEIPRTNEVNELLGSPSAPAGQRPIESGNPSASQPHQVGSTEGPTFQNDLLRVIVGQLSVTAKNTRAVLNTLLENTSTKPLMLALGGYSSSNAKVALSDDRATEWTIRSVNGLQTIYTGQTIREEDFTVIQPGSRINLILMFEQIFPNVDKPGSNFTFSAEALQYVSQGIKRVSIGVVGIMPSAR